MDIISLLVTLLAIVVVIYLIIKKKLNPTLVFFIVGIILLLFLVFFQGYSAMGEETTGNLFLDAFATIGAEFKNQLSGTATNIMLVAGFATLMTNTGSSGKLALGATKPLMKLNKPYLIVSGIIIVSFILKMMITSQAGLSLLLMATVYPIMLSLGVSRPTAAGAVIISGALDWGTNDGAVIYAAQELTGLTVGEYFVEHQLTIAIIVILTIAIVYPLYNAALDRKEGLVSKPGEEAIEGDLPSTTESGDETIEDYKDVPGYYALFPALPLVIVIAFYFIPDIEMDVFTANTIGIILFLIVRGFDFGFDQITEDLKTLFKGMGNAFTNIVTLIVAASIFASSLTALGGVEIAANWVASIDGAQFIAVAVLSILAYTAVIILGSGNAGLYGFGPVIVDVAPKVGLTATQMAVPVQMAASMGRGISPVAAAMIAVVGLAELEIADIVKRTAIPSFVGLIALIVSSLILL